MKSKYYYIRVGYSDGCILLKFSDVDFKSRSAHKLYEKYYKNFKIELILNDNTLQMKHASILHRARDCCIGTTHLSLNNFYVFFHWTRNSTSMALIDNNQVLYATAKYTEFVTLIDDKGAITYLNSGLGGYKMTVHGKNFEEDRIVGGPDAITNWKENIKTIGVLLEDSRICSHTTKIENYKTCIFSLVKGFEIYLKHRFIELGYYLRANYDKLITFYKKQDQNQMRIEINDSFKSGFNIIVPYLFEKYPQSLNFQEYSKASNLYRKVLGIDFTKILLIDKKTIEEIKFALKLRHLHTHSNNFPMFRKFGDNNLLLSEKFIIGLIIRFNSFIVNLQQFSTTMTEETFSIRS